MKNSKISKNAKKKNGGNKSKRVKSINEEDEHTDDRFNIYR